MEITKQIQTTYGKTMRVVPYSSGKSLPSSLAITVVEEPETTTTAVTFWWIVVLLNLNCLFQYPMTVCMWGMCRQEFITMVIFLHTFGKGISISSYLNN